MSEVQHQQKFGIYLLPNLFTTAGLFAAFFAIVMAMKGNYENAAIAIFIAMIADALDGRVARLTNTESAFGAQYDSLSDMVAFAVAPALFAYIWSLSYLGKLGWLAAFIYTASGALRLARFNIQVGKVDKRYFRGLPSPSAAGIVSSFIWLGSQSELTGQQLRYIVAILTIGMGILMVSNIRYYSFKTIDFKGKVPFIAGLIIVLIFVSISIDPPLVLFSSLLIYAISGPVGVLFRLRNKETLDENDVEGDE